MRARAANDQSAPNAGATPRRWPRHTVFYLSVLLTLAIAALAAVMLSKESPGGIPGFVAVANQPLAPNIAEAPERVAFVRIEGRGSRVELQRDGGGWRLAGSGYPVPEGAVLPMLRALGGLRAAYVSDISPPPYGAYGLAGLDDPAGQTVRITARGDDGTQLAAVTAGTTVSVPGGSRRDMTAIMRPNDSRIWLAAGNIEVMTNPLQWVDNRIADVPPARVERLAVIDPDGRRLAFERGPTGGQLRVVEGLPPGAEPREEWLLGELAGVFAGLSFEDVQPARAFAPERENAWRAELVTVDGAVLRMVLLREDMGTWAVVRGEPPAGDREAALAADHFNARHRDWAYLLSDYAARRLTIRAPDLLGAR